MANLTGTPDNDTLRGTAGVDLLVGLAGDDILEGLAGADELRGGSGNDELRGGGASDDLRGGGGDDLLFGGGGNDRLDGGKGDDELEGGGGRDRLLGGGGDDFLFGGDDRDDLQGGAGLDFLDGGGGNDRLDGGAGDDLATYVASPESVVVDLESGEAIDAAGAVDELIAIEGVIGSAEGDEIRGAAGDEGLLGGEGDDLIEGRLGADVLFGGGGDDVFLYRDVLEGGDVIADFETIATPSGAGPGDAIVLAETALEGFESGVSDPSEFFELVDNGNDTELQVDADGGGDDFATLAELPELAATTTLIIGDIQLGDLAGVAIQIVAPDVPA